MSAISAIDVAWRALAVGAAALVALYAGLTVGVLVGYARRALYVNAAGARARFGAGPAGIPRTPGPLAFVALVLREAFAQMRILGWTLMRRGALLVEDGAGDPVLLLHGLMADGTSMWALRRALHERGRPTSAPHLGGMFRPIEKYAERLALALDALLQRHPGAAGVDVVCHSMGGIVLRACLAVRPDLAPHIRHVVTIASPHEGTAGARGVPFAEARQLFVGAPWLAALPTLRALLPQARITTIASRHDCVVYPGETTHVQGAAHHDFDLVGHAELLLHPRVAGLVVDAVS